MKARNTKNGLNASNSNDLRSDVFFPRSDGENALTTVLERIEAISAQLSELKLLTQKTEIDPYITIDADYCHTFNCTNKGEWLRIFDWSIACNRCKLGLRNDS